MKQAHVDVGQLKWPDLHEGTRTALRGKLNGLFGWSQTDEVFNSLAINRQQALLLLLGRFQDLKLWDAVRSITNVYGDGGVGFEFIAWPFLRVTLGGRPGFTKLLAGHRNNQGGFRERKKSAGPALHVVMVDRANNLWAAHFDLYDPLASVLDLWRHIYREGWRNQLPSWRQIGGPLKQ